MTDDPDFGPGCGNPDCICRNPYAWPVCATFQGEGRFCLNCGWTPDRHPAHVHRLHDGPIHGGAGSP